MNRTLEIDLTFVKATGSGAAAEGESFLGIKSTKRTVIERRVFLADRNAIGRKVIAFDRPNHLAVQNSPPSTLAIVRINEHVASTCKRQLQPGKERHEPSNTKASQANFGTYDRHLAVSTKQGISARVGKSR